ncbi:phosphatidylserine/phosphatidylglycerophosphate/cardiolipin synthase family protein [Sphingorhabdus arenilitoris]|uniref:Phospholipase D n=1 Tax=Sphingorhabdus arenilitoris TaxID=1490041 RepID=A0ABV8RKJ1_9SPHN
MTSSPKSLELPGKHSHVGGHDLYLISDPESRLAAVLRLIDGAQRSILMFSYMFRDDESGRQVMAALMNALRRGVSVDLIVDSFGSADTQDSFFDKIAGAGGRFNRFSSRWNMGYFIRNHQKILIADRSSALIGGYNITDHYFGRAGDKSWEDFGVIIIGENVEALARYYEELRKITADGGVRFGQLRKLIQDWKPQDSKISWLLGGPTNRISSWALSLKRDLERAEQLHFAAAYFSPSQSILRRIAKVTRRGNSTLIMAGKTDNGATIPAARSLYRYLLKRGARIFEFQTRPLHCKIIVIDDISYIGSANLDIRSLFINMEIMVRIDDREVAEFVRSHLTAMAQDSEEQTLIKHAKRSGLFRRIKQGLAYLLVNTLDYTIGRRIKFGLLRKPANLLTDKLNK